MLQYEKKQTGGGSLDGDGNDAAAGGQRALHRLRRVQQRLPQGGHPHGAGSGGVPLSGGHGRLRAVRTLRPCVSGDEAAGASDRSGGVRRVESGRGGAAGLYLRRRIFRAGGVCAGGRRRGIRRSAGSGAAGGPYGGEEPSRAAAPAGHEAGAERYRRVVSAGADVSGSGAAGAVLRHALSGGRAVPLSGGASGAAADLRHGVPRCGQPRGVGQAGEVHGLCEAAPAHGGGVLRQARRRQGAAVPRGVRGRRPLRRAAGQMRAGARADAGAFPAARLPPVRLRHHGPARGPDAGGFQRRALPRGGAEKRRVPAAHQHGQGRADL